MEDNKKVNMSVVPKNENITPEKPSYEQLKYWLDKAISDNKNLMTQLNEVTHILNFLPYLFKVVELKDNFESTFVNQCTESITNILTPVKRPEIAVDAKTNVNEEKGE